MNFENIIFETEIKNRILTDIEEFFKRELTDEDATKQLLAISSYNFAHLAFYDPTDFENLLKRIGGIREDLEVLTSYNNDLDFVAVRLENLHFQLVSFYGKSVIDKIKYDQIESLCSVKYYERKPETSIKSFLLRIMSNKRKKALKKINTYIEIYKEELIELYSMYPTLWMIPFLATIQTKTLIK